MRRHDALWEITPRQALAILIEGLISILSFTAAFLLRFDFTIPTNQFGFFLTMLAPLFVLRVASFIYFELHKDLWRYVSLRDLENVLKAVTLSTLALFPTVLLVHGRAFPRSIFVLDWLLCTGLLIAVRVFARRAGERRVRDDDRRRSSTLIIGAGAAGERLLRALQSTSRPDYKVEGLLDDNPRLHKRKIHGVPVLGNIGSLAAICERHGIKEVLLAVPSTTREELTRILERCKEAKIIVKSVPTLAEIISGAMIAQLREIRPDDLLDREPVKVDRRRLIEDIEGRCVLVTGAGGSIGSELSRELARLSPGVLVLYERSENSLYFLEIELAERFPDLVFVAVVGDILDLRKLNNIFNEYRPEIVYHAAAYKHVPLMERQPLDAITNNVFGTEAVANAAEAHGSSKFVLISTDKAVNPVSVMGMSKRVAEDLLLARKRAPTTHITVRFGNVLGSAGSVMPIFKEQLSRGAPITLTDPNATRYFMLINEAAQLVLQAGAIGKAGEVLFLDMGAPVRIMDLAEDLLRLSGLDPEAAGSIETVGLRPGERLREELVRQTERYLSSEYDEILIVDVKGFDEPLFRTELEVLRMHASAGNIDEAQAQLHRMARGQSVEEGEEEEGAV